MSFITVRNVDQRCSLLSAENVCLSALVLTVIAVAGTALAAHFNPSLTLSHKFIYSMLGSYFTLLTLQVLALVCQKNTKDILDSSNRVETEDKHKVPKEESFIEPETAEEAFIENASMPPLISLKQSFNPNIETQKNTLRQRAKHKLVDSKKYATSTDWKQFALMNNTSFIRDSTFDTGHHVISCLQAYLNYLALLKKEGTFFAFEGDILIFNELHETLGISKKMLSHFPRCLDEYMDETNLLYHRDKIQEEINQELKVKGFVYLPAGYCGRVKESEAHAVAFKMALDPTGKLLTVSFLNVGEGVNVHPELAAEPTHLKNSYAYFPAVVPIELWEDIGPTFLAHLLRFISDVPLKGSPYSSQDLYDLLAALQALSMEYLLKHADKLAAKPQLVGDCAEKCPRNIIIDFLSIEKGLSKEHIDLTFLNLHFASIISAYYSFLDHPKETHRDLLINACEEFSNYLLRLKQLLNEEDYLEASEMIDMIIKEIKVKSLVPKAPKPTVHFKVDTLFGKMETPCTLSIDGIEKGKAPEPRTASIPFFKASTFKDDLKAFCNSTASSFSSYNNCLITAFLVQLPCAKWGVADEWNEIPASDIPEILTSLHSFFYLRETDDSYGFLAVFNLFSIADKLGRRIDARDITKNRTFPLQLENVEPYLFFPNSEEQKRFEQIKDYFLKCREAAKEKTVPFPKKWDSLSHDMEVVFKLAAISIKLTEGMHVDLDDLQKITSWEGLKKIKTSLENGSSLEYRLLKFFLKYRHFTANELLCKPKNFFPIKNGLEIKDAGLLFENYEIEQVSQELLNDLMLLLLHPKLQLGLAIQWMKSHYHELNKPIVQKIVEFALFSSGALQKAVHENPESLEELRTLFENGFAYYGDTFEYCPAILFLIQCGATLESYVAEIVSRTLNSEVLEKYKARLRALQSKILLEGERENEDLYHIRILASYAFLESFIGKRSKEDFIELFTKIFRHGTITLCSWRSFDVPSHILDRIKAHRYQFLIQLKKFLEEQNSRKDEILNEICNSIVSQLVPGQNCQLDWQFDIDSVTCRSGEYVLDFMEGSVRHAHTGFGLVFSYKGERKEQRHSEFGIDPRLPWWLGRAGKDAYSEQVMISFDHSTILVPNHNDSYLLKCKGTDVSMAVALFGREDIEAWPALSMRPFIHYFFNDSHSDPYIVSCLKENQKPFMRINLLSSGTTFTRLDEQGTVLPYKLANLTKLKSSHPLYAYTLRFAPPEEVFCFIDEKTEEVEELHFTRLRLSFKKNALGLEAEQYPGYFLLPLKIEALNSFSQDALVLRNSEGKIKLLLPVPTKEERKLGFSKKEKKFNSTATPPYFSFDLGSADEAIQGKDLSEKLFLIYFFKVHGDYGGAYAALKTLQVRTSFDETTLKIIELFFCTRDKTPISLAFTLKLLLFLVDHSHLIEGYKEVSLNLGESSKTKGNNEFYKQEACVRILVECLESATKWYENYLRATTNDYVNGVPIEWRLTEDEEFRILSVMERFKIEFSRILEVRRELLFSKNRSADVNFLPQTVCLSPSVYKNVLPPKEWKKIKKLKSGSTLPFGEKAAKKNKERSCIVFPNQVSETYCQRFFVELFEQARTVPSGSDVHPFDFTLIALLRNNGGSTTSRELASLLFFVRQRPYLFSRLSLKGLTGEHEIFETFNKILKRVTLQALDSKPVVKEEKFPYQKKVVLSLPKKEAPPLQALPDISPLDINPKPFESCRKKLFKAETVLSSYGKEPLFESSLLAETPLEKEIAEKFENTLSTLAQQKRTVYTLQLINSSKVKKELEARKQEYQIMLLKEEKLILESVNDPYNAFSSDVSLAEEREFRLRLNAHQTYLITPEIIMKEAILCDSTALFDEHRFMLKTQHVAAILHAVHRYYHLLVLSSMCSEALTLLEKVQQDPSNKNLEQNLLYILNYEFTYKPEKYPEIAYMKVKTGKLPRKEQAEVYQWVCEGMEKNEKRLFQLSAGGGKTAFMIPLIALRSKRHHLLPFVLTTQAMYGIEKENLANTLSLLEEELDTLEIGMNTKLDVNHLRIIQQQLVSAWQRKKVLILTPHTYYALRLSYFTAVINHDEETADRLQTIILFLQQRAFLIGDESHRNFDPMTQAIFGLGNFVTLDSKEQRLLMALCKPLFGLETVVCAGGETLAELAMAKDNGKGMPDKLEIESIKKTLITHILGHPIFAFIQKVYHEEILNFWLKKKGKEPACLASFSEEQRYVILLARYFFNNLLKQALKMKTDYDHVVSPEQGDIDTPSYYKTPSHAQFKDPYLTFVLTVKGTWQRGLSTQQFRALIEKIKQQAKEEQMLAHKADQTPSQVRFKGWVKDQFPGLTLDSFDLENPKMFDKTYACCFKQPSVIEHFLILMVLSQAGYSAEQFTSSPAHLMDGFKNCVIFSATPLSKLAYPKALKNTMPDDLFETNVIAQSTKPKNQNFVFPEEVSDFFAYISTHQEKFAHVRHMVDAGGFLSHEANLDVAKKWLENSILDGVIYFKSGCEAYEEKLVFRLKDTGTEIEFSRMEELKSTLAKISIDIEAIKIGVFFDAAHAESAHFDPEPGTAAFIFAGDSLTLSHAIQSIMRERGFLNELIDQRIIWVVHKDLKAKMQGKCRNFSSQVIHTWCLKNEVKAKKTGIVMAGFQEIIFHIEQMALRSCSESREAIIKHVEGFREKVTLHATWTGEKKLEQTDQVLRRFAKSFYERFAFSVAFDDNTELNEILEAMIQQVHQKVKLIMAHFHKHAVSEMHQKCVVKKQMHTVNFQSAPNDMIPEPIVKHAKIKEKNYSEGLKTHALPVRQVFNSLHLTENFYIEENQLNTAACHGIHLKEKFLKTIDFILVVIENDKVWAEAISNDMLPKYIKHLQAQAVIHPVQAQAVIHPVQHQAFIVRSDGVPYIRGKGALTPDPKRMQSILESQWMEDVIIDVALLKGKIFYCDRFKKRVSQWPDFMDFWNKILEALPIKRELPINVLLSYLSLDGNMVDS